MAHNFIIGIDLGGTNTKIGLLDKNLKLKNKVVFPTKKFAGRDNLINAISAGVIKLSKGYKILGIGIGLPGPVDSKKGIVHYFPNIRGFKNVHLGKIIRLKTGIFSIL